jgi:lysophospholipase L1-like esterase
MKLHKLVAAFAVAVFVVSAAYAARPQKWLYTALGDSLAVGAIAFKGYVPRYQDYVQTDTHKQMSLRNLAQNGWTSADLLNALRTDDNFKTSVSGATVLTWDIGGNDMRHVREEYKNGNCRLTCLEESVNTLLTNWNAIISEILSRRATSTTIIRTMNLYNPYVNEDKAVDSDGDGVSDFDNLAPYFKYVNEQIAKTSDQAGILCADVALVFNGLNSDEDPAGKGLIAFDGLHPNDTGHEAIASALRALGYQPLAAAGGGAPCRGDLNSQITLGGGL